MVKLVSYLSEPGLSKDKATSWERWPTSFSSPKGGNVFEMDPFEVGNLAIESLMLGADITMKIAHCQGSLNRYLCLLCSLLCLPGSSIVPGR